MNNFKSASGFLAVKKQTALIILTVATAVLLPQIFHFLGKIIGADASFAQAFLPMYLPIMIASFLLPLPSAVIIAILSPLVSYFLSGMPNIFMLPYLTIELVSLAFVLGVLRYKKIPTVIKIIIAQIASRTVKIIFVAVAFYAFGIKNISIQTIISVTISGLYGVALQIIFVPLFLLWAKNRKMDDRK